MSRFDLIFVLIDESNKKAGYAIAKKIFDRCCYNEKAHDWVYSREDLLRYIDFARSFKPFITRQAGRLLMECYATLRYQDASVAPAFARRITVRQLESLIHLSEAVAKVHCSGVTVKHVHEAYRLLKKSLMRVGQLQLLQGEDDSQLQPENIHYVDLTTQRSALNGDSAPKENITFEEYRSLRDVLVVYMIKESESGGGGLRKSDLVKWYLEQLVNQRQIENEDVLATKKILVELSICSYIMTLNTTKQP